MSRSPRFAIAADTIFDGRTKHHDAALVIQGSTIVGLGPQPELPADLKIRRLRAGAWLAPGFIDIQVNGGGDVLFNNSPRPNAIRKIAAAHRKFGTTSLLPTFITDSFEKMRAAVAAAQSMVGNEPSVLGIHLEGPFLLPEKAGVHDPKMMRSPGPADRDMLCGSRKGELLVTLAPERVPKGFIADLVRSGVRVSLGHSMATYDETFAAMDEGLNGFTHLFNAMRPMSSREPGPIAAALESASAWFGMIVDGFHVSPAMLRLALRGLARPILVTDAMPPVGGRRSKFELYGTEIEAVGGRCARPDGTLAGSALDMASAVRNCVRLLHVPLEDALCFASRNPAEFLGLGHLLGGLRPGYRADLVALDPHSLEVLETWGAGVESNESAATDASKGRA
jgi:N-acetylglucosamine-6-phosphate deacetylase